MLRVNQQHIYLRDLLVRHVTSNGLELLGGSVWQKFPNTFTTELI